MNRQPKITRREQQAFIRDEGTKWLHFAVRNCPCNGLNCPQCDGSKKYFDEPVPVWGALTNGMNTKKKEAQFPGQQISTYKMLVEPRYRIAKGDRVTPFGMREFEMTDEIIPVIDSTLTYMPINPRGVEISFVGGDGWEALNKRAHIIRSDGEDVTEAFLQGAAMTLKIARICKSELALLKDKSPSCGIDEVTISNEIVPGIGVTTALLKKEGFALYSDRHWQDLITDHLNEGFIRK